jgi:RimJ/RimL family protein N-acetyltransferase
MSENESQINFRPLAESDFELMFRWFNLPHVQSFYSLRDWTREEIREKLSPYLREEKGIKAFIITLGAIPIGYIQFYPVKDHPWKDQDLLPEIVQKAAGLDLFIGEKEFIGRGFGPSIIEFFLQQQIWPDYDYCLADPDVRNEASLRLFEKTGFLKHKIVDSNTAMGKMVRLQLFLRKKGDET